MDYIPTRLVPTEGAFMGRLKAGTTEAAASEMRCHKLRSRPGRKSLPVGAVAAFLRASRRPQRGGPSRKYPGAQAVRHPGPSGGGIVQRQPTARCPLAHTAVSKRYTSPG